MNKYYPEGEQSLEDMSAMIEQATKTIDETYEFLKLTKEVVQTSGESLDAGTLSTLKGLISALNTSVAGLAQTDTIQNAKDTIKGLVDDEWDKFSEEKATFLNMDETLDKVSFTSSLNQAPESIQIIMRTDEITVDDEDENVNVDEDFHAQGNFFTRVASIFKKIFDIIKSVFSN